MQYQKVSFRKNNISAFSAFRSTENSQYFYPKGMTTSTQREKKKQSKCLYKINSIKTFYHNHIA